jgi:hypothetical protein
MYYVTYLKPILLSQHNAHCSLRQVIIFYVVFGPEVIQLVYLTQQQHKCFTCITYRKPQYSHGHCKFLPALYGDHVAPRLTSLASEVTGGRHERAVQRRQWGRVIPC